jgi:hypothetical protein
VGALNSLKFLANWNNWTRSKRNIKCNFGIRRRKQRTRGRGGNYYDKGRRPRGEKGNNEVNKGS